MQKEEMVAADEFCLHHNVEISFLYSLQYSGLVEVIQLEEGNYIPLTELQRLEKLVRLHEMDINLEGIETIAHLLERMDILQQEILSLNNRLRFYEITE